MATWDCVIRKVKRDLIKTVEKTSLVFIIISGYSDIFDNIQRINAKTKLIPQYMGSL